MKLKLLTACLGALLLAGTLTACAPTETGTVTIDTLFHDPARYDGRKVTLETYFYQSSETIVICEGLKESGYAPGHMVPVGRLIWVEGGIPRPVYDALTAQTMMGPTERHGQISISGIFNYGGKYGHGGQFQHQISPETVLLRD